MTLTPEQLVTYIEGKETDSQAYKACEDFFVRRDANLFSALTTTLTINNNKSNLLSAFACGTLKKNQNEQIKSAILNAGYCMLEIFGIVRYSPSLIYAISDNKPTNLFTFWLQDCLTDPSSSRLAFLDDFMCSALGMDVCGISIFQGIKQISLPNNQDKLLPVALWIRHLKYERIQKALLPSMKSYFQDYFFLKNIINIKGDEWTNLVSLWANDHQNDTFNTLLWQTSNLENWTLSYWNFLKKGQAYAFITSSAINYANQEMRFVDLSNQEDAVGAVSRQQLNKIIPGLTAQERYQLLCCILGLEPQSENLAWPAKRLSTCRDKIEDLKPNTYQCWLANALLAARKPTGIDYARYVMAVLSPLALVGATGALLLLHFVAAMPVMSALLHPALLAGGVLCVGAALGLFLFRAPRVSSIGQVDLSECPFPTLPQSQENAVKPSSLKNSKIIKELSRTNNNEEPLQIDENNTQDGPGKS